MSDSLKKLSDEELSNKRQEYAELLADMPASTPLEVRMHVRYLAFLIDLEIKRREKQAK